MRVPLANIDIKRVLVSADGKAVSLKQATNVKIGIVFIRDDGWTLAAPKDLVIEAFETWPNHWVEFWRDGERRRIFEFSPMAEPRPRAKGGR